MDPLSDVLSLSKLRSYISGGFPVDGDVAVQFPKHQGIKCYAVVSGQCWLSVESVPDPVLLTAGDCFLLPRGLPFCLTTDLSLTPVDYRTFLSAMKNSDCPRVRKTGVATWLAAILSSPAVTPKFCCDLCPQSCISGKSRTRRRCAGR